MANAPEKKFRAGAISATIWLNEGKTPDGKPAQYRTISVERNYKDNKDGKWKTTASMRVNDLPKIVLVANQAYEYLVLQTGDAKKENAQVDLDEEVVY